MGEKIKNYQKGSFIGEVYIATDGYLITMYNGNFHPLDIDNHKVNENPFEMNM